MILPAEFPWQPLLQGSAQTILGAIASYGTAKGAGLIKRYPRFDGALDFWKRGVHQGRVGEGSYISFEGVLTPFFQLFPVNPLHNALRWNRLYNFEGRISKEEYQTMEFYVSADALVRIGSVNGETVVGLFSRYGYGGDGILGVVSTKYLSSVIPSFFEANFTGTRARVKGRLKRCPHQHHTVIQSIIKQADIGRPYEDFRNLLYLNIEKIEVYNKSKNNIWTLRGSPWAVTKDQDEQYIIQYVDFSQESERKNSFEQIQSRRSWSFASVFYDEIDCPSFELGFKKNFL